METKRTILASLGSNLVLDGKKVSINMHPTLKTIADYLPQAEKEIASVRTFNKQGNKKKNGVSDPEFPSVLRRVSDVRTAQGQTCYD